MGTEADLPLKGRWEISRDTLIVISAVDIIFQYIEVRVVAEHLVMH